MVADINTSIVSSGQTAEENNYSWTFGPGKHGSVTSHSNNITFPLTAVDRLYPLPKHFFTSTEGEFQLRPQPTVFTCLPCVSSPTNTPVESTRTDSVVERAREAARKLKESKALSAAGGARETYDSRRGNSSSTPISQESEKPFGSTLRKAQLKAAELRAMRKIGEALLTPDQSSSTSNPSTPLRMSFNPLSVYASKSKLAPGKFKKILTPLSDPVLDEISDNDEENTGKGEQYEQLHYVAPRFLSVPKTPPSRKQPNKLRTRDLHNKLHNHASTLKAMRACPEYRKNGLKCEPTDIDPYFAVMLAIGPWG